MFIRRLFLPLLTLLLLAVLAGYSVLLAMADAAFRQNTLNSAETAVHLVPSNASYHALLAEVLEESGANPDAELRMATVLSPHESRYWIRRAFRAEVEQKYDESERFLMEAHRVDRGFDPRWALMNYYFRRGRLPEFWKSARETLEMSYGDLNPIFRLCLSANTDPSFTARILPPRRAILLSFFSYLVQHKQMESVSAIAAELAATAETEDVPLLLDYCNRQMGHDNQSSLTVWNSLCRRHLLGFTELAPDHGNIVTNTDLVAASLQQGFDWRYGKTPEIKAKPIDTGKGISFEVSGFQPDSVAILEQEIPLTAGKQYLINYEYRLIGERPDSGLEWTVRPSSADATGSDSPVVISPVLSGADWNTGQLRFSAGQLDAARLILQYRRLPGTVRWKGTVQIRRVTSGLAVSDSFRSGPH
jgi:hypothetical protein